MEFQGHVFMGISVDRRDDSASTDNTACRVYTEKRKHVCAYMYVGVFLLTHISVNLCMH